MTLSDYLDQWLPAHAAALRPATASSYRTTVAHIKAHAPEADLAELTPLHLANVYAPYVRDGHTRTAQLMYAVLVLAMRDAVRMGLILRSPMDMLRRPAGRAAPVTPLTVEQTQRLLAADTPHRAAWGLLLLAGLRKGEAAGLQWQDVENAKIHVCRTLNRIDGKTVVGEPKSDAGHRFVPLPPILDEILTTQKHLQMAEASRQHIRWEPSFSVITETGVPLRDPRTINRWLDADLARLKLPRVTVHALRHTMASNAVDAGVEMRVLQVLLGHASISTTAQYYAHVRDAARNDAIMRIATLSTAPFAAMQ